MAIHLRRDLDRLQRDLLALASLVEETIHKAVRALAEGDVRLAREVIANDGRIDQDDNLLHEECLKILALHAPVAGDLRRIMAAMLITTDLERMGDIAEEIAERAIHIGGKMKMPDKMGRMADLTTTMVHQVLDSFVNLNKEQAERVVRMDDEVDRYNREIISDLVDRMKASPELIEPGMSMFSATRHLERIADHATNIAEDVIYLISGEIVKHREPKPG